LARPSSHKDALVAFSRHSSGFEQLVGVLQSPETLSILDLAGASQANVSFITNLGHRLSSEDILATLDQCFGKGDDLEAQQSPANGQRFLDQLLNFPDQSFDAALVWDTLQYLTSPLLEQTVDRLLRVVRPGGLILAFFHADEKASRIPVYHYRIQDQKTLSLTPRGDYRQVQYFNNRALERMFGQAQSLKFFLTRDHLREVVVRR
jgi:SAM-dependent methyltransferase